MSSYQNPVSEDFPAKKGKVDISQHYSNIDDEKDQKELQTEAKQNKKKNEEGFFIEFLKK